MKDPRSDVIRVMLVDDMRGARTGFMMMLNNAPDIIVSCQAADGAQAIGYLRESPHQLPDVILMDVRMPVMDGIEATGIIKEEFPQIRILILTTYDEDDYAFDGLARGASGFLLKDATPRQLRDAVHAVYNGDAILTPRITGEVINRGVRTISDNARIKLLRGLFNSLSKREHEVAELVATGLSNQGNIRAHVHRDGIGTKNSESGTGQNAHARPSSNRHSLVSSRPGSDDKRKRH